MQHERKKIRSHELLNYTWPDKNQKINWYSTVIFWLSDKYILTPTSGFGLGQIWKTGHLQDRQDKFPLLLFWYLTKWFVFVLCSGSLVQLWPPCRGRARRSATETLHHHAQPKLPPHVQHSATRGRTNNGVTALHKKLYSSILCILDHFYEW